jgi:hypothetical protein
MADTYVVKDGNGNIITISAKDEGGGVMSTRTTLRIAGADVSSSNGLPVTVLNTSLTSLDSKSPALGQAVMASSMPVTIASNQTSIPVTITSSLAAGFGTTDSTNLGALNTKTPPLGQAVMSASTPVVIASNQPAIPVSLTGVATAAKQPALGIAGSPSADVITVQGAAGGQPIPVTVTNAVSGVLKWASVLNPGSYGSSATNAGVATTAGRLFGYVLHALGANAIVYTFHNTTGAPAGTTSILWRVVVPAGGTAHLAIPDGWAFSTGLRLVVTDASTGVAPATSTAYDWSIAWI